MKPVFTHSAAQSIIDYWKITDAAREVLRRHLTAENEPTQDEPSWTEDQLAHACAAVGISDSAFQSLLVELGRHV